LQVKDRQIQVLDHAALQRLAGEVAAPVEL
jgi:hypothetical protein